MSDNGCHVPLAAPLCPTVRLGNSPAPCYSGRRKGSSSMTIHLSKDMEQIVHNAVLAGLYASEDDVIRAALTRLEQTLPKPARTPAKAAKRPRAAARQPKKKPLTVAEIHQQMLASGLITALPDPSQDIDDDDPDDLPVIIKGEPLSETIIRERR
jgi:Arc/MetJ-type ribon-helix-helix transcriptional regulator